MNASCVVLAPRTPREKSMKWCTCPKYCAPVGGKRLCDKVFRQHLKEQYSVSTQYFSNSLNHNTRNHNSIQNLNTSHTSQVLVDDNLLLNHNNSGKCNKIFFKIFTIFFIGFLNKN